ncbi:hypothetical protein AS159_00890 [Thermotoga sp. Ku-13t]|uniref:YbgA family protein n=1 Tax=Thermotoga sp. Ku-13t TaxID=1755813 RepID=UPI0013ECD936|nr:DUF523 and DUF1722 domain-containing protein [Thermotoga sp. Ku-13t]KAF2958302.1 hypothetical protein AS159_00890 [Thermotoga sp. Ku-13t]
MNQKFPKPKVVFSACLVSELVRYNGKQIRDEFCEKLAQFVDVIKVCPEVGINLPVPRNPMVIIFDEKKRVVQKKTNRDLTEKLLKFSVDFLEALNDGVDGFVLKGKSPSCALRDATAYRFYGNKRFVVKTSGIFAEAVMEKFPKVAFIDESGLKHFWRREHFLCRIFASAELREVIEAGSKTELLKLHERYKYLLMAHSPSLLKKLGKLVSNLKGAELSELFSQYRDLFRSALSVQPTRGKHFNVLQHIYGYFKDKVDEKEKRKLVKLLNDFSSGSASLTKVRRTLTLYAQKLNVEYLLNQRYLRPYPEELEGL